MHALPRLSLTPALLQSCARVELDHPMSDITRYPCSSYRPVEVQLARLNALSGLELSCPVSVLCNRVWGEGRRRGCGRSQEKRVLEGGCGKQAG